MLLIAAIIGLPLALLAWGIYDAVRQGHLDAERVTEEQARANAEPLTSAVLDSPRRRG